MNWMERQSIPAPPRLFGIAAAGCLIVGSGFGGFGLWAAQAPLASAAVAPGIVRVESHRKIVQHQEGGIISALLVRDGQIVEAGELLLRLEPVDAKAEVAALRSSFDGMAAREARLVAERDGAETIAFPPALRDASDPAIGESLANETRRFEERRDAQSGRIAILKQRLQQYRARIGALDKERQAARQQLALVEEELETLNALAEKQLARRSHLLEMRRTRAELLSAVARVEGDIAIARQSIAQTRLEIEEARQSFAESVLDELQELRLQIATTREKLRMADGRLGRTEIVAQQAGTVMALRYFAAGAVVPPGGAILDLVPHDDRMMIDAKVSPADIDVVRPGLKAEIRLAAYKHRNMPPLMGEVRWVSADIMTAKENEAPHFIARVEVAELPVDAIDDVRLYPGMQAEVMIVTGEATMLEYLFQPVRDSFARAFRES